jgi:hypothetical protein
MHLTKTNKMMLRLNINTNKETKSTFLQADSALTRGVELGPVLGSDSSCGMMNWRK